MKFADQPLAELAIDIPMASALFRKNRLDFCCGGKQTLRDACSKREINLDGIVRELEQLQSTVKLSAEEKSLTELTAFVVERYHEDLRKRLPELLSLAEKVERVHADHESCPKGLASLLRVFHEEMLMHMMKEENVLFPLINSGRGNLALMPIKVMSSEHDSHGIQLEKIHQLTSDFTPPAEACGTWRTLYKGLEKLEEELMDHIHLENNILFPKALSEKEV